MTPTASASSHHAAQLAADRRATAGPWWTRPRTVALLCWAALAVPMVVALVAQHRHPWHPIADLAQTELRVRDVGGSHTPLVGLAGRIGTATKPGSHPGPLSFWLLAPLYRLLGSSPFALQVSASVLHLAAFGLSLWLATRRGGLRTILAVAATLAVIERFFGGLVFFEPWNPYLPTGWWTTVLLAAWSILDDDLVALPVFVLAGSMCAQTHLPYVGLVGGLIVVLAVLLGLRWWRGRPAEPEERRRRWLWTGGSVLLGVVLWAAPAWDQVARTGNLGLVVGTLRDPSEAPVGVGKGLETFLRSLDPVTLVFGRFRIDGPIPGSVALGALLVVAWAAVVALTWRSADRRLRSLHSVTAAALVLGAVASAKVTGQLWFYLFLWARTIGAVGLLATVAGAAWSVRGRADRVKVVAPAVALAVLVGSTGAAAVAANAGKRSEPVLTRNLGVVADQLERRLQWQDPYLITWTDDLALGSQGFGLLDDLERHGHHVGVLPTYGSGAVPHRVLEPGQYGAVLHVVVGHAIETYERQNPGADRVAFVDSRTPAEKRAYRQALARVRAVLARDGRKDDAANAADRLFLLSLAGSLPKAAEADAQRAIAIDRGRTAVFLEPPPPAG